MKQSEISKKIKDCFSFGKNNKNMLDFADMVEGLAKFISVAILVVGLIIAISSSFEEKTAGYYYEYTENRFSFLLFLSSYIAFVTSAAIAYGTMYGYSILVRCMAEISQNTLTTSRLIELQLSLLNSETSVDQGIKTQANPQSKAIENTETVSQSDMHPLPENNNITVRNEVHSSPEEIRSEITKLTAELNSLTQFEHGSRRRIETRIKMLQDTLDQN